MTRIPIANAVSLFACLVVTAGLSGCWVHVDKDANGQEKNVQVDTPFGGVHVNTDQTTAADLGLPEYPGSQRVKRQAEAEGLDKIFTAAGFGFIPSGRGSAGSTPSPACSA